MNKIDAFYIVKENIDLIIKGIRENKTIKDISKQLGLDRNYLYDYFKTIDFYPQDFKFNHNYFENIDNEHKAYWLGFIMADGCVSRTHNDKLAILLHKKDIHILESFKKDIEACINIYYKEEKFVSLTLYSSKLCDDLEKIGCTQRKSLTLQYPILREDLNRHFIRGYFDGDGCIYFNKKTNNMKIHITGTSSFLNSIQFFMKTNVKLQKPSNAYGLCLHGNEQVYRLYKYIYQNSTIFLNRKKNIFDDSIKNINNVRNKNMEVI